MESSNEPRRGISNGYLPSLTNRVHGIASMRRLHWITSDWLRQSGLTGEALLLESLLRRGFLAYRDAAGVWLGKGSHPVDLDVLKGVQGLRLVPVLDHHDQMAKLKLRGAARGAAINVASRIIALFDGYESFTTGGIPDFRGNTGWNSYRRMIWGAKLPIGPAMNGATNYQSVRSGALDLGIALLVKALPLARVATSYSCDGHGERSAEIGFCCDWDPLWGRAVFESLGKIETNSIWNWSHSLTIAPRNGFSDTALLGMLTDIQRVARSLLNQSVIDRIGRARSRVLQTFDESPPSADSFAQEARTQLAAEFH